MINFNKGRGPRDPAFGLPYNKLVENYMVSRNIYTVDIARTPMIVTNKLEFIDVHNEVDKVNSGRRLLDQRRYKIGGRF